MLLAKKRSELTCLIHPFHSGPPFFLPCPRNAHTWIVKNVFREIKVYFRVRHRNLINFDQKDFYIFLHVSDISVVKWWITDAMTDESDASRRLMLSDTSVM